MVASTEHGERIVNHGERIAALERQSETEQRHLATKADISDVRTDIEALKSWLLWRVLIAAAVIQGVIATLIKYLPAGT